MDLSNSYDCGTGQTASSKRAFLEKSRAVRGKIADSRRWGNGEDGGNDAWENLAIVKRSHNIEHR
ncbi:MAG: hypothetical protein P2A85_28515 [Microcoleus anatoxicus]|uniref:hypothetical protein n=1 Tax=Microcoleus anatoxicus TaxID=2705319 RepID=UPI0036704C93